MIEFDEGEDALEQIRNFNGPIRVMETPVLPATQQEYFRLNLHHGDVPDEDELEGLIETLDAGVADAETLKLVMVKLTNSNDVKAYRCIERFASEQADEAIRPLALLCLEISKMRIETSLSDEQIGYIAGGMGGHDLKLRFFMMVFPNDETGFTDQQLQLVHDEFRLAIESVGGVTEVFDNNMQFVGIVFLLPVKIDFKPTADQCLKEINQYGNFLFPAIYATNVGVPGHSEILDIIGRMRKG